MKEQLLLDCDRRPPENCSGIDGQEKRLGDTPRPAPKLESLHLESETAATTGYSSGKNPRVSRGGAVALLNLIFVAFSTVLILWVAGLPMHWVLSLADVSSREFHWFAIFGAIATLMLVHTIAASDSTP